MITDKELSTVAKQWLSPIDRELADLIDKSHRMTIGSFAQEVEALIQRIPALYYLLDRQALIDSLEDEIGLAITKALEENL